MGSVRRRRHFYAKGNIFWPTAANFKLAQEEVSDYEYVEIEPPPDMDHGIIWAHSLGASPHDLFGELVAWIDHRLEEVKRNKNLGYELRALAGLKDRRFRES